MIQRKACTCVSPTKLRQGKTEREREKRKRETQNERSVEKEKTAKDLREMSLRLFWNYGATSPIEDAQYVTRRGHLKEISPVTAGVISEINLPEFAPNSIYSTPVGDVATNVDNSRSAMQKIQDSFDT